MAFLLEKTNPNFSVSRVHGVLRLETQNGHFVAVVNSYATPEAFDANMLNWQDSYQLPLQADPTVAANPQAYLIGPEGPFAGATVLEEATPLERLQSVKWAEIKGERDRREKAPLSTSFGVFQADAKGRANIESSVAMLRALLEKGESAEIHFTLADDSSVLLTYEQMRDVGLLLGQQIDAAHQVSRALRERIFAEDATAASVAAVQWAALV